MADWSLIGELARVSTIGGDTSVSNGTLISSSSTANTKGSFTELSASTPIDAEGLILSLGSPTGTSYLVDVAVGAGGSEKVILSNLAYDNQTVIAALQVTQYEFPIFIPSGSRITVRIQDAAGAGQTLRALIHLMGGGANFPEPLGRVTTYGAVTSDSGGTSVDPGGTANTKGSYSEIVASTTNHTKAIAIGMGNQANADRTAARWLLDIAIGASGSEQVIISNLMISAAEGTDIVVPQISRIFPFSIPAGTRIAARAQCTITDATDRLFDVIIYGID